MKTLVIKVLYATVDPKYKKVYLKLRVEDQMHTALGCYDDKWKWPMEFVFNLSDHAKRFASVHLDVYETVFLFRDTLIGRAELRLSQYLKVQEISINLLEPNTQLTVGIIQIALDFQDRVVNKKTKVLDTFLQTFMNKETGQTLGSVFRMLSCLNQGLEWITPIQWVNALLLIQKFHESIKIEEQIVHDVAFLSEILYYHQYSLAVYGWKGLLYFGKVKSISNTKSISRFLPHIQQQDWIEKQLTSTSVFVPGHFVVYDQTQNAIILSIRGTMSATDAITDLVCEYQEFDNGLVHKGIIGSAHLMFGNLMVTIMNNVKLRKPKKLYVVGHSLGGGIATFVSYFFKQMLSEFQKIVSDFEIKCFAFGPPPVCTQEIDLSFVTTIVYNNDLVPRLSFGSVMDLREMLLCAVQHENSNFESKIQKLHEQRQRLKQQDLNPKLFLAGNVFYISKTPQMQKANSKFDEILIQKDMFSDHMPNVYDDVIRLCIQKEGSAEMD